MGKKRVFGEIVGVLEGEMFDNREHLKSAGVHNEIQAGISGSQEVGAESIVVSGGYEDDVDNGDEIIYTGSGGRKKNERVQTFDQELTRKNLALARSCDKGLPVRVTRRLQSKSGSSPKTGYQYAGIYYVEDYWSERGRSGFIVWRYRLVKDKNSAPNSVKEGASNYIETKRTEVTIQRVIRSTRVAQEVKELYNYKCQVCGERLEGVAGPYAEGAHIKGLGKPHNGPDTIDNILCLCPNHHVLFDKGGLTINDDFTLNGYKGRLKVDTSHCINVAFLRYHRGLWN